MKGKLRYIVIAFVVLVVLVAALPFLINVNQFRPTVEEELSAVLHRQVKIGNLKLSLLSGSLTADNLSIADDPAFSRSAFLNAKSFRVGVEMMPLIFSKQLRITRLSVERPEVTLLRNPAGKWNYSSLAVGGSGQSPSSTPQSGGASPELAIKKLELKDGRVAVGSTTSTKQSVYDGLNLEASSVSLNSQFPLTLSAKLPGGGSLKLDGKVGPVDHTDASLTPVNAKLAISSLDLARTGFLDPASGIAGIADLNSDISSANGTAKAKGTLKLDKFQMAKGGSPAGTPINVDFDSDYDLRRSAGTLNDGTVKIGNAVAHLTGTFENQGDSMRLNLKLNAQNMPVKDLQSDLPAAGIVLPKGASLQQGTVNANLNAAGPADKLVTTGDVGLFNATLTGFDLGAQLSAVSAFTGTKSGNGSTSIEKLTTNLRAAPEGIQLSSLLMVLPGFGQVSGNGTISAPSNALNFKMVATLSTAGGVVNVVGGLAGQHSQQIPFLIEGTTSAPKFIPDVRGMAGSMVSSKVGSLLGGSKSNGQSSGIGGALGGILGKSAGK
ncbi:MAG: AsmA family protein [Candidatus Korobacteraceae bacterium]